MRKYFVCLLVLIPVTAALAYQGLARHPQVENRFGVRAAVHVIMVSTGEFFVTMKATVFIGDPEPFDERVGFVMQVLDLDDDSRLVAERELGVRTVLAGQRGLSFPFLETLEVPGPGHYQAILRAVDITDLVDQNTGLKISDHYSMKAEARYETWVL